MVGSQRSRCSGVPHASIEPIARPECTPKKLFVDASIRAISAWTKPMKTRRAGSSDQPESP